MRPHYLGAGRFAAQEFVHLGDSSIKHGHAIAVIVHVQNQVLAHHREANQSDITTLHDLLHAPFYIGVRGQRVGARPRRHASVGRRDVREIGSLVKSSPITYVREPKFSRPRSTSPCQKNRRDGVDFGGWGFRQGNFQFRRAAVRTYHPRASGPIFGLHPLKAEGTLRGFIGLQSVLLSLLRRLPLSGPQ